MSDATETAANDRNLVVLRDPDELPPILAGHQTPELRARAKSFYAGVAELFERWAARRPSHHTHDNISAGSYKQKHRIQSTQCPGDRAEETP